MIGCVLLGIAGAFVAARLFHYRHHGHGCGGFGRWGCGGGRRWMGDDDDPSTMGPRGGGSFWVRALSRTLDATPAQEKVIRTAVTEFRQATAKLRDEGKRTRTELGAAFRKSSFDEVVMGELFARHDSVIEEARKAFVGMGAHIHDALDEGQRERLARLIESGGWWRGGAGRSAGSWGGPWRHQQHHHGHHHDGHHHDGGFDRSQPGWD